jgi:L-asparagine transporter-like permease
MTGEIMLDVFIGLVLVLLTFEKSAESTLSGSEAELVLIVLKYYYLRAKERSCENRVNI